MSFPTSDVMKKPGCSLLIVLAASVLWPERFAAQQADLHVVATFGDQGAMEKILPEYKRASSQNVSIEYEESAVIQEQIASGKVFDLAIRVPQVIDGIIKSGQIKPGTRTDIAKTSIGIDVRVAPAAAIVPVPGVDFLGLLPAEFQTSVVFAAGIGTRSERPDRAKALVEFIGSSKGAATLRASGMEPAATAGSGRPFTKVR